MKESGPNFHQIHEEINYLKNIKKQGELPAVFEDELSEKERQHKDFTIKDYRNLDDAKRELRFQKEIFESRTVIDNESIQKELGGDDYLTLDEIENKAKSLRDLLLQRSKRLREMSNNPVKTELGKRILQVLNESCSEKQTELNNLENKNKEVSRIFDLLSYRKQLFSDGHIAEVPSVEEYLNRIEEAMIEGKPMFLHGPTGTGKTSLAVRSAEVLTGKKPEMVYCNPQSKASEFFGRIGIVIDEETKLQVTKIVYGHLSRAAEEGRVIIFDEFTALPQELTVLFKGVMSKKVGDTFTVPGDGEITIAPGFQMIFTSNLKSEKNKGRAELPPEIKNEFGQNNIEVNYQSKEESYDIMLSRLMNADGSIEMSEYDLKVTLKNFAEVVTKIQKAYTDKVEGDTGSKESLQYFVINQRNIENILSRWKTAKIKGEETDFVTFLDKQLAIVLTFKDYSEKDRRLASEILHSNGFLHTIKAEDLGLPSNTFTFSPDTSSQIVKKSKQIKRFGLREVASLDPFEVRGVKTKADQEVDNLLNGIKGNQNEQFNLTLDIDSLNLELQKLNKKAKIDKNIEGGSFHIDIDQQTLDKLKDYKSAIKAFEEADNNSSSSVDIDLDDMEKLPWEMPKPNLDFVVVKHGQTTQAAREKMVKGMDKLGYRVPTFSEFLSITLLRSDLNKTKDIYFNAYKEYSLRGLSLSPCFCLRSDGSRWLVASSVSSGWSGWNRFLFVRK